MSTVSYNLFYLLNHTYNICISDEMHAWLRVSYHTIE